MDPYDHPWQPPPLPTTTTATTTTTTTPIRTTPRREIQIQGPRPAPLRVRKDSVKIKKPPMPPRQHAPAPALAPAPGNQPVIIYSVSPKPIFVEASNFRLLVQQLTGRNTPAPAQEPENLASGFFSGEAPVSPAARLAAMERTSPSQRERERRRGGGEGVGEMMVVGEEDVGFDVGQMPGILSPAPENLPVISPGMFSPAGGVGTGEEQSFMGWSELMSPFMSNTSFLPSPSALLLSNAPIVSPRFSPGGEFFNIFDF